MEIFNKVNIKGSSIETLKNLSSRTLNSLTRSELSRVVSRLASAGNKRVKRLMKANDVTSPALFGLSRTGNFKFSVKGKNTQQLLKEFLRVKQFLEQETSTVKGARKVQEQVIRTLKREHNISITNEQYSQFFRMYEKLKEINPAVGDKLMKYNVLDEIAQRMDYSSDLNDVFASMLEDLEKIYEESVNKYNDYDISQFFRLK